MNSLVIHTHNRLFDVPTNYDMPTNEPASLYDDDCVDEFRDISQLNEYQWLAKYEKYEADKITIACPKFPMTFNGTSLDMAMTPSLFGKPSGENIPSLVVANSFDFSDDVSVLEDEEEEDDLDSSFLLPEELLEDLALALRTVCSHQKFLDEDAHLDAILSGMAMDVVNFALANDDDDDEEEKGHNEEKVHEEEKGLDAVIEAMIAGTCESGLKMDEAGDCFLSLDDEVAFLNTDFDRASKDELVEAVEKIVFPQLSPIFFKKMSQEIPAIVVVKSNGDDDDDENVSTLYDDPAIDDRNTLPLSTVFVLETVFDGLDEWFESDDEESEG